MTNQWTRKLVASESSPELRWKQPDYMLPYMLLCFTHPFAPCSQAVHISICFAATCSAFQTFSLPTLAQCILLSAFSQLDVLCTALFINSCLCRA